MLKLQAGLQFRSDFAWRPAFCLQYHSARIIISLISVAQGVRKCIAGVKVQTLNNPAERLAADDIVYSSEQ